MNTLEKKSINILELSNNTPVVVDFWAPWCGPCRFLVPILEELEKECNDAWKLIKINVDENPDLSREYQVRSIPDVRLFYKGRELAKFNGALPKVAVQQWLNNFLPSEEKEELARIKTLLEIENNHDNRNSLKRFLEKYPENVEARLLLAKYQILVGEDKGVELVSDIKLGDQHYEKAEHIRNLMKLLSLKKDNNQKSNALLVEAGAALRSADYNTCFEKIIEALSEDKNYENGLPRLACIALFELLGREKEISRKFRRKFDMILFS